MKETTMIIETPEQIIPTTHIAAKPGAVACVKRLMLKSLNRNLSVEQNTTLWLECRALMVAWNCKKVVREIEEDNDVGILDTYPREYLMDAVAHVLTGMHWPANMDSKAESDQFAAAMKVAFNARGYARNVFED
jgi:hypothetical protein